MHREHASDEHLDEGTVHAWLDDALSSDDAAQVARHVASCPECAAVVAEARGLIAGSSRILNALDEVPGDVIPTTTVVVDRKVVPIAVARRRWTGVPMRAAAALLVMVGATTIVLARRPVQVGAPSAAADVVQPVMAPPSAAPVPDASASVASAPVAREAAPKAMAKRADEARATGQVAQGISVPSPAPPEARARLAEPMMAAPAAPMPSSVVASAAVGTSPDSASRGVLRDVPAAGAGAAAGRNAFVARAKVADSSRSVLQRDERRSAAEVTGRALMAKPADEARPQSAVGCYALRRTSPWTPATTTPPLLIDRLTLDPTPNDAVHWSVARDGTLRVTLSSGITAVELRLTARPDGYSGTASARDGLETSTVELLRIARCGV